MNENNTEDVASQIKKNKGFEVIKSVCASYGAVTISLTAAICGARLLNGNINNTEKLKRIDMEDFTKILGISSFASLLLTPVHLLAGYASSKSAADHNKKVDGFTNRLEQEKAAAPLGQPR